MATTARRSSLKIRSADRGPVRAAKAGRVRAVLARAEGDGLLLDKDGRITGRLSRKLIAEAKARTGISSDTELVEFALASVALEDGFAEAFAALRGTIDPELDLEF